jgi:hypothetical protein
MIRSNLAEYVVMLMCVVGSTSSRLGGRPVALEYGSTTDSNSLSGSHQVTSSETDEHG